MTEIRKPQHTVRAGTGEPVRPSSGSIVLDAFAVPYGTISVDIPYTTPAGSVVLDPRDDVRLIVDADAGVSPAFVRTFDMGIRARVVDYERRTISVQASTDEALLTDYMPLSVDAGASAHGTLRGVVGFVLSKIGATLEPGTVDGDARPYWEITNVLANPDVAGGTVAPWTAGGNVEVFYSTGQTNTPPGTIGDTAVGLTSQGPGLQAVLTHEIGRGPSVAGGRTYVLSGYGRQYEGNISRRFYACIRWLDNAGAAMGPDVEGEHVLLPQSTFVRAHVIATAPPAASRAEVFFRIGAGVSAGQYTYVDAAMFYEGSTLVPFFNGSAPDDSNYAYSWAGDPNKSASIRTPFVERPPEMLTWNPGTSAWDFLAPLLSQAGFRLFCDELRAWRLIDPATYVLPGLKPLTSAISTAATDTISREDPQLFATGVVVRYSWTDDAGIDRVRYDSAGTPNKVVVIDYARPYPGSGAAAAILARRDGTGRMQEVTALLDLTFSPNQSAAITLPDVIEQQGRIGSVTFDLGDAATMTVGTLGLIDIPSGSWLDTDPDEAWTDPPAISWNQWT